MNIAGISFGYHDASCCILSGGRLLAAAQEERFTRRKQDPSLPRRAFRYCLQEASLSIADLDCIAYYENPEKKLSRQIWMGLRKGLSPVQRESLWTLPGLPANFAADFYRAYGEESVFVFVGEVGLGVELDLTCRLPAGSEGAPVRVTVNGGQVLAQPGACRWQHYSVLVPGALVRQGMNEVRIWWPVPDLGRGEQNLARAADALERGGYPELFPVFGELHTFVARGAPEQ